MRKIIGDFEHTERDKPGRGWEEKRKEGREMNEIDEKERTWRNKEILIGTRNTRIWYTLAEKK